jgi:hypothetical protein
MHTTEEIKEEVKKKKPKYPLKQSWPCISKCTTRGDNTYTSKKVLQNNSSGMEVVTNILVDVWSKLYGQNLVEKVQSPDNAFHKETTSKWPL